MVEQVPKAVQRYGAERLGPGDVLVTNDPHPSGVHLNDVSLISPVHDDGGLIGYVANLAHHVDVGGGAPASIGAFQEVFQEGVIVPPVKLVADGVKFAQKEDIVPAGADRRIFQLAPAVALLPYLLVLLAIPIGLYCSARSGHWSEQRKRNICPGSRWAGARGTPAGILGRSGMRAPSGTAWAPRSPGRGWAYRLRSSGRW